MEEFGAESSEMLKSLTVKDILDYEIIKDIVYTRSSRLITRQISYIIDLYKICIKL